MQPACQPALGTGLLVTPQSSLQLTSQEPGASPSKAKVAPGPRLPYLGEDAEEGEEEELLLQLEPHAALPSATAAHHPPGSLEAAACLQVLKPRLGPAGVYTLPALMSLTGSNINMRRFGQASRFSSFFSLFLFFPAHIPAAISTPLKVGTCCPPRQGGKGWDTVPRGHGRGLRGVNQLLATRREAPSLFLPSRVCTGRAGVFLLGLKALAGLFHGTFPGRNRAPTLYFMLSLMHGRLWERCELALKSRAGSSPSITGDSV